MSISKTSRRGLRPAASLIQGVPYVLAAARPSSPDKGRSGQLVSKQAEARVLAGAVAPRIVGDDGDADALWQAAASPRPDDAGAVSSATGIKLELTGNTCSTQSMTCCCLTYADFCFSITGNWQAAMGK